MRNRSSALKIEQKATIFAALGDPTRLTLVSKLTDQKPHSISSLTEGTVITRQAITKHLSVLENVGLVSKIKNGRESQYIIDLDPIKSIQEYLEIIASDWENSLVRLKNFVESQN